MPLFLETMTEERHEATQEVWHHARARLVVCSSRGIAGLPFKSQWDWLVIPVKASSLIPWLRPVLIPCFIVLWFPFWLFNKGMMDWWPSAADSPTLAFPTISGMTSSGPQHSPQTWDWTPGCLSLLLQSVYYSNGRHHIIATSVYLWYI